MKPLVFFVKNPEDPDGKITITKAELEAMITQAYEAGKSDGSVRYTPPSTTTPLPVVQPIITCRDRDAATSQRAVDVGGRVTAQASEGAI